MAGLGASGNVHFDPRPTPHLALLCHSLNEHVRGRIHVVMWLVSASRAFEGRAAGGTAEIWAERAPQNPLLKTLFADLHHNSPDTEKLRAQIR